jgi:hypothetical protein
MFNINSRIVDERRGCVQRERFKQENGKQQITEASSPIRGQSSNSGMSEVVDSVIKTTDYTFGNEVTAGFRLVRA